MALTNIIQEPRREITESAVGITISAIVIAVVYLLAVQVAPTFERWWIAAHNKPTDALWIWTLVAMVLIFFGSWIALAISHAVGESFCNNLARRGLELRPQDRRRR